MFNRCVLGPEGGGRPPSTGDMPNQMPRQGLEVSQELLQSGVITLPGEHGRLTLGRYNKIPGTGYLLDNRHVFLCSGSW